VVEVVVVALLVTVLTVIGALVVVEVEATVEVAISDFKETLSSFGRTNPGGSMFDTSSVEIGKTDIPFSLVVGNGSKLESSSTKIWGLSVSYSRDSCSVPIGLSLRLIGILVTGTSVGLVVFLLEVNWPGSLFNFLLGDETSDLLSSSSGTLLFSMSSSLSLSSLFFPNFCLLLIPDGTILDPD